MLGNTLKRMVARKFIGNNTATRAFTSYNYEKRHFNGL